jgi:STE24 endopeptidase
MLEFLQYVVALVIVAEAAGPGGATRAAPDWLGIALALLAFALGARIVGSLIARASDGAQRRGVAALLLATNAGRVVALGVFYMIAGPLGGALVPRALGIEQWFVVPALLALAPFFVLVAALVWGLHPAAKSARVGARTPAGAVLAEFRGAMFSITPVAAWIVIADVLRLAANSPGSTLGRGVSVLLSSALPAVQAFFWLGLLFVALLVLPFLLRFALRAKPLPDGPLRRRLDAYSRRVGFSARDILVWPTGGDAPNAFVVGALPWFRYAFLTDGLLKTLDEDEIEAVFAHEAGHARRGHVLLFFGFSAVLALVQFLPGADGVLGATVAWMPPIVRSLVVLVVWLGVVFGWVSRRFEQEADVFGIETVPFPRDAAADADHPFARALERIGKEVGAIHEVTGWRHFSIADRVAFARSYVADAEVRRRWRRSILLLRGVLLTVIFGFALAAAVRVPGEIRRGAAEWQALAEPESRLLAELNAGLFAPSPAVRAARLAEAAVDAERAGKTDETARWLRESVALDPRRVDALWKYAEFLEKSGRPLGARLAWAELAETQGAPEAWREEARRRAAEDPR